MLDAVSQQMKLHADTSVKHVSLCPRGGWFIKYTDGSAQISGLFPDGFLVAVARLIDLNGMHTRARQPTLIDCIWFGTGDSFLFTAGTTIHWEGIPTTLASTLKSMAEGSLGFVFVPGASTVLCPWALDHYFVEAWTYPWWPLSTGGSKVFMEMPANHSKIMTHLMSGYRPPQELLDGAVLARPVTQSASQPPSNSAPPAPSRTSRLLSDLPELPDNMRLSYQQQFVAHSGGGSQVDGSYAARIFFQSGLPRETLSEIWELIDEDSDGKLDMEEYVQAMWHIETRLTGPQTKVRFVENGGVVCDGCRQGLNIGEEAYYCSVCAGGDYDLCQFCQSNSRTCPHQMSKVTLLLGKQVKMRQLGGEYALCDGCAAPLPAGAVAYWCNTCNNGDFDICERCWKNGIRGQCTHNLYVCKLQAASPETIAANLAAAKLAALDLAASNIAAAAADGPALNPPSSSSAWETMFTAANGGIGARGQPSEADKTSRKYTNSSLKDSLLSSIVSEKPNVKWTDVAGLGAAKGELQEAIIFPLRFPQMFRGKRRARRALLLYGPPGTGKSYLAKAVATEVDHTLFSVSSGDVMSKWSGESEG